ncbi:hypothetical protein [Bacillus swezeyi]|uniref:hypothetical protein n=1 Tax=Bacillus swezeyi TaxID=1925020 RepID=UPI0011E96712|nr:hypothetical protein [Bacillus swezeyi]TYS38815.1 hypothetical protein FZC77_04275 [Bacillus swezeyi]
MRRAKDVLFITAVVLAVLDQILFVFLTGCLRVMLNFQPCIGRKMQKTRVLKNIRTVRTAVLQFVDKRQDS